LKVSFCIWLDSFNTPCIIISREDTQAFSMKEAAFTAQAASFIYWRTTEISP